MKLKWIIFRVWLYSQWARLFPVLFPREYKHLRRLDIEKSLRYKSGRT